MSEFWSCCLKGRLSSIAMGPNQKQLTASLLGHWHPFCKDPVILYMKEAGLFPVVMKEFCEGVGGGHHVIPPLLSLLIHSFLVFERRK